MNNSIDCIYLYVEKIEMLHKEVKKFFFLLNCLNEGYVCSRLFPVLLSGDIVVVRLWHYPFVLRN